VPSCWSCLVILEPDVQVCPFCGADQTRPVAFVSSNAPQPLTLHSFFHDWGIVIAILAVAVCSLAGVLWHNLGGHSLSPSLEAAQVAAKSLREIREGLSAYALSAKDTYPATLDPVGESARRPMLAASRAGYILNYSPQASAGDGTFRSFVLRARPEKSNYLNLYNNETGVVRATGENRPATGQDPPF
jgi:hypothetical protein